MLRRLDLERHGARAGTFGNERNGGKYGEMKNVIALLGIVASFLLGQPAMGAEPAAIVEEVSSPSAGIGFMDYVSEGRSIDLGSSGKLTLGYLRSCMHEEIKGGRVKIGRRQSTVEGGRVKRKRVNCGGGQYALTPSQAGKSGVAVFRRGPGGGPKSSVTVYSISPIFKLSGDSKDIVIERLDRPSKIIRLKNTDGIIDMIKFKQRLERGSTYKASAGSRSVIFSVDRYASERPEAVITRLVSF